MPDISKLEQLCEILHISIDDLLGVQGRTVTKIINKEEASDLTVEEIRDVMPLLPPKEAEDLLEDKVKEEDISIASLISIAPFLDDEFLDSLVERVTVSSLKELCGLAPFLSEKTLDSLMMQFDQSADFHTLASLAPFASDDALDTLVEKHLQAGKIDQTITALAPFLSQKTMRHIAEYLIQKKDFHTLQSISPFC